MLWRPAAIWGVVVGTLQALATLNEWPLMWMTYDTAVPRTTFIAGQMALLGAAFVGFSVFLALSFMAAETLTRRAFGHHPQFWRVWAKGPGRRPPMLGRTAAGYLLVSVFFAYDVVLYLYRDACLRLVDALRSAAPPRRARDLCALALGDRQLAPGRVLGRVRCSAPCRSPAPRSSATGSASAGCSSSIAFIVQAIIFGAGHAPYPTQPSYARPVELILPSIGFGLLYVYFGLLPGIILHFAFDVVWFALPIFLSDAPGIWFQKAMVIVHDPRAALGRPVAAMAGRRVDCALAG